MTCRHSPGDPNCSSHPDRQYERAQESQRERDKEAAILKALASKDTPDAKHYEVVGVVEVSSHLVMKVLFPNCSHCSFEGSKVIVWLNTTPLQALMWKQIDPHFRDKKAATNPLHAPGPDARFPASPDGWIDAVEYAKSKVKK